MKNSLQNRLNTLKSEYESGQRLLTELDARRAQLTQTMLRIEGAMQLLNEVLEQEPGPTPEADEPLAPAETQTAES
jgi:predicted nuclease with TOPRIM domain